MAMDRGGREPVVLAWEAPGASTLDERIAALDTLASRVGGTAMGIVVPWDPVAARAVARVVELLARRRICALPLIRLDVPQASSAWTQSTLPESLHALATAGVLCEFDGIRYAVAAMGGSVRELDALPAIRRALAPSGRAARVGWLRRASPHLATPAALDFALDWPPFGPAQEGAPDRARQHEYSTLALDLAKRHGGETMVVPSVLWSPLHDADLYDGAVRVSGISPLRTGYAVDTARRFVRNRVHHGVPFWALRAAFSPADRAQVDALDALAQMLARAHRPSAAIGRVAGLGPRIAPRARIAVVVHLYYPDLWGEMADAIKILPEAFDLFVSCPYRLLGATQRMVRRRFAQADVFGVQNLGRDVLPFLLWLRAVGPQAYTYVLKLHAKKSVHIIDPDMAPFGGGDAWRRSALAGLLGSAGHAAMLLRALDAAPDVGLVAASGQLYDQVKWKCATTDLVVTALKRLRIDPAVDGVFPAGTMFWARAEALAPLAFLADEMLDFEREAGQVDGTLHHAYERLVALVASALGFRVTDSAALLS